MNLLSGIALIVAMMFTIAGEAALLMYAWPGTVEQRYSAVVFVCGIDAVIACMIAAGTWRSGSIR